MPPFADALAGLAALPGVAGVALVNTDGLPIDVRGHGLDPDEMAALAATILRHADQLGAAVQGGTARTLVVEFTEALTVLGRLDEATAVIIAMKPGHSAAPVLTALRTLQLRGVLGA